ncbi:sulfotransferase family 2 domain-containing protein [Demequina sp. NBRC 110051]|uniref:sulfotransferase family 2 domain-containing protein n=1 Tax=Demequina sp. NBRC 110051 TaxID=1570340 RepID=UPI000A029900|nr:sulfotransferase family 2 domain-containing protein [Demequina sp. NBRC 110051]
MPIFRRDGVSVLFAHIPKTGGSSIDDAFRAEGWSVDLHDGKGGRGSLNQLRRCSPQHQHGALLEATLHLDRFDAIFSFVRDPLQRLLSEFVWRARTGDQPDLTGAAVEQWVSENLARTATNPYWFDNHLRPQHEFLVAGGHVLRFEDGLGAGLSRLAALTDLDIPKDVPHRLRGTAVSGFSTADVEVTDATRALVAEHYWADYRRLGYAVAVAAA